MAVAIEESPPAAVRVFHAQPLNVGDRRQAGGIDEAPLERAFGELGALHHLLHGVGHGEVLAQPFLRAGDLCVAVIALAAEHDVGAEALVMPLQGERFRDIRPLVDLIRFDFRLANRCRAGLEP